MKLRWLLFLGILGISAIAAFAQAKTVTNFDLEKYREQRVKAEKDLRENYEQLGFSSPEVRAKRDEVQRKQNAELAARFEQERIDREAAEAAARLSTSYEPQQTYYQPSSPDYLGYGGGLYYVNSGRSRFRGGFRQQLPAGYFAGGAFWPPPSTVKQPILLIQPRVHPRH